MAKSKPKPLDVATTNLSGVPTKLQQELLDQYGIQETSDVIEFFARCGQAYKKSLEDDGVVTIGDSLNFINAVTAIPAAIAGIGKIPLELGDKLSDEEQNKLMAIMVSSGVIPEEAAEATKYFLKVGEDLKRGIVKYFIY